MTSFSSEVAEYIERFRQGDPEGAFFGLIELNQEALPEIIARFRAESDIGIRAFLIEIVWQHRQEWVIPFLGEVLCDPEPLIWKEALDGLVTVASPAALDVLRSTSINLKQHQEKPELLVWVDEAIEQVEQQCAQ
jgi:hypothetical protein